jgi:hypothetical protein
MMSFPWRRDGVEINFTEQAMRPPKLRYPVTYIRLEGSPPFGANFKALARLKPDSSTTIGSTSA